jgi:hypothetical protein
MSGILFLFFFSRRKEEIPCGEKWINGWLVLQLFFDSFDDLPIAMRRLASGSCT